jgi:hypothetical protein
MLALIQKEQIRASEYASVKQSIVNDSIIGYCVIRSLPSTIRSEAVDYACKSLQTSLYFFSLRRLLWKVRVEK